MVRPFKGKKMLSLSTRNLINLSLRHLVNLLTLQLTNSPTCYNKEGYKQ